MSTPEQLRSELFCDKEEAIQYSPFGTTHFYEVVLKDPRFPQPITGADGVGKKFWSKKQIEDYWRQVAESGFKSEVA